MGFYGGGLEMPLYRSALYPRGLTFHPAVLAHAAA
jgi:hypothetical protein